MDPGKVEAILKTPKPTTSQELRGFLGIEGYHSRFIRHFADRSAPLHAATSVKLKFEWTKEMDDSFSILKDALTSPPVLSFPDFEHPFSVRTDASSAEIGAVLAQKKVDGKIHPIQFASRTMTAAENK